ncbi:MAG: hypothetical protein ACD_73C00036G0002 [uncultured bacterium]|nr:MAG: hypothetical protein ACD_73C00036G0002 [uncultured bacterium]
MDFVNAHILSILVFFPVISAVLVMLLPMKSARNLILLATFLTVLEFVFSLHLTAHFANSGSYEFMELIPWIKTFNINYFMGIDGVSLWLILLTTFLTPLVFLGSLTSIIKRPKEFVVCMLLLQAGMVGVFCALDLFLFYVFWEVMLIPMYFIIGIWGGDNRVYAAIKFFIYTMTGSVLMLIAILWLYFKANHSFNLMELYELSLTPYEQYWLFLAFALAFAIKVPLFPFHTWLPDAHVQAPTAGSVILAGVLLKMGTYGFYRFAMPLFPHALLELQVWLIGLAVIGIVYGALVAMVQTDIKKLIAYSSVSHLGVVMLGLFSLDKTAMLGGLYQMLNHGISTGALFLMVGMLYERTHSREISQHGGLAHTAPWFVTIFLVVTFSSIGLPLTNGFVGEFLSLVGTFRTFEWAAIIGATGVILSAIYMLWLAQRVFFGPLKTPHDMKVTDINMREVFVMIPLLVMIVWMGVAPNCFLKWMDRPVDQLILQMQPTDIKASAVK